jgi:hypothetical protein
LAVYKAPSICSCTREANTSFKNTAVSLNDGHEVHWRGGGSMRRCMMQIEIRSPLSLGPASTASRHALIGFCVTRSSYPLIAVAPSRSPKHFAAVAISMSTKNCSMIEGIPYSGDVRCDVREELHDRLLREEAPPSIQVTSRGGAP